MKQRLIVFLCLIVLLGFAAYYATQQFSLKTGNDETKSKDTPAIKTAEKTQAFGADYFELANGLKVVLIENHRAPIVSHMLWYYVGAADESWGKSGIAHFFEHLMFKGTKTLEPGEYSKRVRALGGKDNAFTGQDYTAYFVNIAVENLPEIMRMEADRMVNLIIPEDHFLSERNVILEERAQRTDTKPAARLSETLRATLFPNHAYGVPVIGWREEIAALDYKSAMDFYAQWYAPNNAVLVVAGAITRDELEPLANEIYGAIPAKSLPDRPTYGAPTLPGKKLIRYRDPQVKQASYSRLCRVPSYHTDKDAALALEIASNIIDGGAATRLYQHIVKDKKLATNAGIHYSGFAKKESVFYMSATPRDGIHLKQLAKEFNTVIEDYTNTPPSDTEIREAKDRLINSALYARDSLQGPAYLFGQALTTGMSLDDVEYWSHDIENVKDEDIRNALSYISGNDNCVSGFLMPPAPLQDEADENSGRHNHEDDDEHDEDDHDGDDHDGDDHADDKKAGDKE